MREIFRHAFRCLLLLGALWYGAGEAPAHSLSRDSVDHWLTRVLALLELLCGYEQALFRLKADIML